MKKLLSIKEAAEYLEVTERTLYRYLMKDLIEKDRQGKIPIESLQQFKSKKNKTPQLYNETKLAQLLRISKKAVAQAVKDGILKPIGGSDKKGKEQLYDFNEAVAFLNTYFLKDIKLFPEHAEFIHEEYNVAEYQQFSFEKFPKYMRRQYEDNFRDNVYVKTLSNGEWVAVISGDEIPLIEFLQDYQGVEPIINFDTEDRWPTLKTKAVHFFLPLSCLDSVYMPERNTNEDLYLTSLLYGTWIFPITTFFYTHWGIRNSGIRVWHTESKKIPDPFVDSLPNGEVIVQISAKQGYKKIDSPLLYEVFEKNEDILNTFAFGGNVRITNGQFQVFSDGSITNFEQLKNLQSFPYPEIFDKKSFTNAIIHKELLM